MIRVYSVVRRSASSSSTYPTDTYDINSLRREAEQRGCSFRLFEGAIGLVANEWDELREDWSWDLPAVATVIDEGQKASGQRYRVERSPSVLSVVEHEDEQVLRDLFDAWRRLDSWEVPVVLLAGMETPAAPKPARGNAGVANLAGSPETGYFVTYSQGSGEGTFRAYAQLAIVINGELWEWLPEG